MYSIFAFQYSDEYLRDSSRPSVSPFISLAPLSRNGRSTSVQRLIYRAGMAWLSILLKNARKERGSRYSAGIASFCPVTNDSPSSNANWRSVEAKSRGEKRRFLQTVCRAKDRTEDQFDIYDSRFVEQQIRILFFKP